MPHNGIRIRRGLLLAAAVLGVMFVGTILTVPILVPLSREWVVRLVSERFKSDVELESLSASLFPRISATGTKLVVRHKGRTDVPPLISIRKVSIEANLFGLLPRPKNGRRLTLEGLDINLPPHKKNTEEIQQHDQAHHI